MSLVWLRGEEDPRWLNWVGFSCRGLGRSSGGRYPDCDCGEARLGYSECLFGEGGVKTRFGMFDEVPEAVDGDRGTG